MKKKMIVILLALFPMFTFASSWRCSNDIEVMCSKDGCGAADGDDFTPVDVRLLSDGWMDVCAYTGCWSGKGKISVTGVFTTFYGQGFRFSTSPDRDDLVEDIIVMVDKRDNVAVMKNSIFAQPLLCTLLVHDKTEKKSGKNSQKEAVKK